MALKFYIQELIVTGPGKPDASLRFEKGLNLISGASDTGKSFVFSCIDFMMGASSPPNNIDEMAGYDTAILIITTKDNRTFTLKRSLMRPSTPFFIKEGDFNSGNTYEKYGPRFSITDPNNISSFFLKLLGLDKEIKLKKNKDNVTVNLSFRDIAGLFMVNEETVISKKSPVFQSGLPTNETKEISLFNFLLSGNDASTLEAIEDNKIRKSKIEAQIEIVEGLIKRKEIQLNEFNDFKGLDFENERQLKYESLNLDYNSTVQQIDEQKNIRSELYNQKIELESKKLFNIELLDRFKLLKDHYKSDIKRLDFIAEGNFLFDQLNEVCCPICGSNITNESHEHFEENHQPNEKFSIAIQAELGKLKLKQDDLDKTIEKIGKENRTLEIQLSSIEEKIEGVERILQASLEPVSDSLKIRLQEISKLNDEFNQYELLKKDIDQYTVKIQELIIQKNTKPKVAQIEDVDYTQNFTDFTNHLKSILESWNFENVNSVLFDTNTKVYDVSINGKLRSSRGKGFRALTYTAFLYSLLKYNLEKCDTHPGILIIDSPLTTFRDKDPLESEEDEIELPGGIEAAFFNSFINTENEQQVIIFENKEPDEKLLDKMNYIHFSKEKTIGRYGFFEPL